MESPLRVASEFVDLRYKRLMVKNLVIDRLRLDSRFGVAQDFVKQVFFDLFALDQVFSQMFGDRQAIPKLHESGLHRVEGVCNRMGR